MAQAQTSSSEATILPIGGGEQRLIRRRIRSSVACERCRAKKVKCDQEQPCGACSRSRFPDRCTYLTTSQRNNRFHPYATEPELLRDLDKISSTPNSSAAAPSFPSQAPFAFVKASARGSMTNPSLPPFQNDLQRPPGEVTNGSRLSTTVFKQSRSKHLLRHDTSALIETFFREACEFRDVFTRETKSLQKLKRLREVFPKPQGIAFPSRHVALQGDFLCKNLPDRQTCDRLVDIYFVNLENVWRIMYKPYFMTAYNDCWLQETPWETMSTIGCSLMLMVVLASPLDSNFTLSTSEARKICNSVSWWLDERSGAARFTVDLLQTRCLLLVCRKYLGSTTDAVWRASGDLIRSAMIIGLHRDPADASRFDARAAEVRRRLWTTILELENQASLDLGVPTAVRGDGDFSSGLPAPMNDTLLEGYDNAVPQVSGLRDAGSLNYYLATSLSRRIGITNLVATDRLPSDTESTFVSQLPPELQTVQYLNPEDAPDGAATSFESLLGRLTLHVLLLRTNLTVSQLRALEVTDSVSPETTRVRAKCIEVSMSILSLFDVFDTEVSDVPVADAMRYWGFATRLHFKTILQAAYSLCLEVKRLDMLDSVPTSSMTNKATLMHILNRTLNNLIERSTEIGSHLKDLLWLSIVIQLVRTNSSKERKQELMRIAIDRFSEACYRRPDAIATSAILSDETESTLNQSQATSVPATSVFPSWDFDLFNFDFDGISDMHPIDMSLLEIPVS